MLNAVRGRYRGQGLNEGAGGAGAHAVEGRGVMSRALRRVCERD